jgi:hypothetical protein
MAKQVLHRLHRPFRAVFSEYRAQPANQRYNNPGFHGRIGLRKWRRDEMGRRRPRSSGAGGAAGLSSIAEPTEERTDESADSNFPPANRSELIYLLVSLDKQYTAEEPAEPWQSYYARQLLAHFSPTRLSRV